MHETPMRSPSNLPIIATFFVLMLVALVSVQLSCTTFTVLVLVTVSQRHSPLASGVIIEYVVNCSSVPPRSHLAVSTPS
jgi:hypothetical protein